MLTIQQQGEAILADVMQDENVVKLMKTFDKKQGMVDTGLVYEDGKKVKVTKGMRMALVMHGMNKDNLRHMVYGGVTMPNMDLYLKGDKKGLMKPQWSCTDLKKQMRRIIIRFLLIRTM